MMVERRLLPLALLLLGRSLAVSLEDLEDLEDAVVVEAAVEEAPRQGRQIQIPFYPYTYDANHPMTLQGPGFIPGITGWPGAQNPGGHHPGGFPGGGDYPDLLSTTCSIVLKERNYLK